MRKKLKKQHNNQKGYIALISAVIISAILISLTVAASGNGFLLRFDVLNSEFKRVSLSLAESCVSAALLKIGQNYNYVGGETLAVGSELCVIKPISYFSSASHQKTAIITASVNYHKAFSTIKAVAIVADPAYPQTPLVPNISIISWLEE